MMRLVAAAICLSMLPFATALAGRPLDPRPVEAACEPTSHFAYLELDSPVYRQGARIGVRPMVDISPAGSKALPKHCVRRWSVSGPARLSANHSRLKIDENAAVGSEILVTFFYRDEPVVTRLRVVGRGAVVLTDTWSQESVAGCGAADVVRELQFSPGDKFSVTFSPFETYRDYWGSFTFDPESGALRMTVNGGNFVPTDLDLEGRADLAGGKLTLHDLNLGSRSGGSSGGCTYVFHG